MIRRLGMLAATATTVIAALAVPARAADGIGLSLDGRTWSDSIRQPLFDAGSRWVPGDSETRSFYVRDQGPTGARLTVDVLTRDGNRLIADDDLLIEVRADGGAWGVIENGGTARAIASGRLGQGARARVDVRVGFRPGSVNESQSDVLPLDFRATLVDGSAGPDAGGAADGLLPGTGSALGVAVIWSAAALLGSGLALLLGRRRKQEEPHG